MPLRQQLQRLVDQLVEQLLALVCNASLEQLSLQLAPQDQRPSRTAKPRARASAVAQSAPPNRPSAQTKPTRARPPHVVVDPDALLVAAARTPRRDDRSGQNGHDRHARRRHGATSRTKAARQQPDQTSLPLPSTATVRVDQGETLLRATGAGVVLRRSKASGDQPSPPHGNPPAPPDDPQANAEAVQRPLPGL